MPRPEVAECQTGQERSDWAAQFQRDSPDVERHNADEPAERDRGSDEKQVSR
jgi:hypothetical protein